MVEQENLLSGLVVCKVCGLRMNRRFGRKYANGNQYTYFTCEYHRGVSVNARVLETTANETIQEVLTDYNKFLQTISGKIDSKDALAELVTDLQALEGHREVVNRKRSIAIHLIFNLDELNLQEIITQLERVNYEMKELEAEIWDKRATKDALLRARDSLLHLTQQSEIYRRNIVNLTTDEKRVILEALNFTARIDYTEVEYKGYLGSKFVELCGKDDTN